MAKPGRPVSESYKHVCCSVSQSLSYGDDTAIVGLEDEDDQSPIFSISKSSMDVVMATGAPHKRDPAWTRMSLRRSSSTNTHCEQDSVILQQLRSHVFQQVSSSNSHHLSLTTHNLDMHSPPALSEYRVANNMQGCSESSGNIHSRSSTPETVVWKGGASCSSILTQEACNSSAPDSPTSKLISPPTTPSPFTSSLHTPTVPPVELLNHQEKFLVSSPATSPLQVQTSSPLTSNSPSLLQLSTRGSFHLPSQKPLSGCLVEDNAVSDVGSVFEDSTKEFHGPGDLQLPEGREARSPDLMLSSPMPASLAEGQEVGRSRVSPCHLQLPSESCLAQGCEKSPHVSSLSDSQIGDCCRCKVNSRVIITRPVQEEGTVTSQVVLVDAEVQTVSPIGSWWDLRRNIFTTNIDSHSNLGSPPGSRLNLKSSVGSISNLVSPSSSMFPVSSEEEEERREEDQRWDINSASSQDLERRRPCLKMHGSEREEMGRRSSMKQVQWDEEGMTWDIHGASVDPEELSTAIQKHLEFQNSPRPLRPSTKKKRAPKPPLILSVVKVMAPELNQSVTIKTSPCMMEGEGDKSKQVEEEGGGKKVQTPEVPCGISRAEGEKNTNEEEDDEVYGEEGISHTKSPLHGIDHTRKKSGKRSLRRPGWCGSSRKANN